MDSHFAKFDARQSTKLYGNVIMIIPRQAFFKSKDKFIHYWMIIQETSLKWIIIIWMLVIPDKIRLFHSRNIHTLPKFVTGIL